MNIFFRNGLEKSETASLMQIWCFIINNKNFKFSNMCSWLASQLVRFLLKTGLFQNGCH